MTAHADFSPTRRPRARGFTLVEVLIAMALLMAVVGTSFAFMSNLLKSRQQLLDEAARQRSATLMIDRLEAALLTCIAGDSASGPGIAGDDHSIAILMRGVAAQLAEQGFRDPRVLGDLQRLEFHFDESQQTIEGRMDAVSLPGARDDAEVEAAADVPAAGAEAPFWSLGSVAVVRFRYHDGSQWVDSFDSIEAGGLPTAVEVAIWFEPWPRAEGMDAPSDEDEGAPPGANDDESERVFDEDAFGMRSELELYYAPPPPDRLRVIAVPDPAADDSESVEFSEEDGVQ